MQTRLLSLLQNLSQTPERTALCGLWLVHTDDPLAVDWLIDACRPLWAKNHQIIKRIELSSPKSWHDVASELSSLSLFDEHTALIVTGKHKIDPKDTALTTALSHFAQDVKNGISQNHLIWCLPKQDKKALSSKGLELFAKEGTLIDANIYDERTRGELLRFQAKNLGLALDDTAWAMLMQKTEHNLLSAYQTLWRLSFLPHKDAGTLGVDDLAQALVAGEAFDVFDLSDALLAGNSIKVLQILRHLKNTSTAPSLVLWAIAKDVRLILQLHAGKNPYELGIWQNKINAYLACADRTAHIRQNWLDELYKLDRMIKGLDFDLSWISLETLCLSLCGVDFLPNKIQNTQP